MVTLLGGSSRPIDVLLRRQFGLVVETIGTGLDQIPAPSFTSVGLQWDLSLPEPLSLSVRWR